MHLFISHNPTLFHMNFSGFKLRLKQGNNIIVISC
jgi:hypothetical protein